MNLFVESSYWLFHLPELSVAAKIRAIDFQLNIFCRGTLVNFISVKLTCLI